MLPIQMQQAFLEFKVTQSDSLEDIWNKLISIMKENDFIDLEILDSLIPSDEFLSVVRDNCVVALLHRIYCLRMEEKTIKEKLQEKSANIDRKGLEVESGYKEFAKRLGKFNLFLAPEFYEMQIPTSRLLETLSTDYNMSRTPFNHNNPDKPGNKNKWNNQFGMKMQDFLLFGDSIKFAITDSSNSFVEKAVGFYYSEIMFNLSLICQATVFMERCKEERIAEKTEIEKQIEFISQFFSEDSKKFISNITTQITTKMGAEQLQKLQEAQNELRKEIENIIIQINNLYDLYQKYYGHIEPFDRIVQILYDRIYNLKTPMGFLEFEDDSENISGLKEAIQDMFKKCTDYINDINKCKSDSEETLRKMDFENSKESEYLLLMSKWSQLPLPFFRGERFKRILNKKQGDNSANIPDVFVDYVTDYLLPVLTSAFSHFYLLYVIMNSTSDEKERIDHFEGELTKYVEANRQTYDISFLTQQFEEANEVKLSLAMQVNITYLLKYHSFNKGRSVFRAKSVEKYVENLKNTAVVKFIPGFNGGRDSSYYKRFPYNEIYLKYLFYDEKVEEYKKAQKSKKSSESKEQEKTSQEISCDVG